MYDELFYNFVPIFIFTFSELTFLLFEIKFTRQSNGNAEVAELADALCSERSESNLVRVQVPPSAQV